uniref:Uncharacterized protein n=1 Tax=Megaselia scalaris TaxID=36166 RepID=T1H4T1_MEGSC
SPYTSYENGVTTAGLSLSIAKANGYTPSSTYSPRTTTSRLANNGKSLSISNSSLNSYTPNTSSPSTAPTTSVSVPSAASIMVSRSSSLREHERKSRNRTRSRNIAQRSLSASSEKSEGYESGTERTSRSRLGSTNSLADGDNKQSNENGEIDYKALWEAAM